MQYNFCLRIDNMISFFICYSVRTQTLLRTAALFRLEFTYRRQRKYIWHESPLLRYSIGTQELNWATAFRHCMTISSHNFLHRNFASLSCMFYFSTLQISLFCTYDFTFLRCKFSALSMSLFCSTNFTFTAKFSSTLSHFFCTANTFAHC